MKVPSDIKVDIFSPSVDEQSAHVFQNNKHFEYNLAKILEFKTDIQESLATHSATQQYWENLAIEVTSAATEFEEISYAKWGAHARRYARLVMHNLGIKETLESLKDWMITLFGSEITDQEKDSYVNSAYRGWLLERFGTLAKVEKYWLENETNPEFHLERQTFRLGMLGYQEAGWTYEKVQKTLRQLKDQAAKVQSFARSLNGLAFNMKAFKDLEMAKYGNVEPHTSSRQNQQPVTRRVLSDPPKTSGIIDGVVNEAELMNLTSKHRKKQ